MASLTVICVINNGADSGHDVWLVCLDRLWTFVFIRLWLRAWYLIIVNELSSHLTWLLRSLLPQHSTSANEVFACYGCGSLYHVIWLLVPITAITSYGVPGFIVAASYDSWGAATLLSQNLSCSRAAEPIIPSCTNLSCSSAEEPIIPSCTNLSCSSAEEPDTI